MRTEGRVVVITGGGGGIGAAMATRFAAEDDTQVVVTDIDGEAAAQLPSASVGLPSHSMSPTSQRRNSAIEQVEEAFGRIDILCLNAGIATGGSVDTAERGMAERHGMSTSWRTSTRRATPFRGCWIAVTGYIVSTALGSRSVDERSELRRIP